MWVRKSQKNDSPFISSFSDEKVFPIFIHTVYFSESKRSDRHPDGGRPRRI